MNFFMPCCPGRELVNREKNITRGYWGLVLPRRPTMMISIVRTKGMVQLRDAGFLPVQKNKN